MKKHSMQYPEPPMQWYALSFSYFFGLLANDYFFHALFLFALLYIVAKSRQNSFYILTLLCFCLGFIYGTKPIVEENPSWLKVNIEEKYSGHIESIRSLPDKRLRLILTSVSDTNKNILPNKTVLYLYYDDVENLDLKKLPLIGMDIEFKAKIRPVSFSRNNGILDGEKYWYDQKVFYSAYLRMKDNEITLENTGNFFARSRNALYLNYIEHSKDNSGNISASKALLLGILFGERFFLETEDVNLFANTALVHSLALSGMHLAFVGLCGYILTKLLVRLKPSILFYIPFAILLGCFTTPLALGYLWLGNMPISLIRASCMLFIYWFALILYKRLSLMDNLILTASLLLIFIPRAWANISFQLSFCAVFSIALSVPYFTKFRMYCLEKYEDKFFPTSYKILFFFLALLWTSLIIQIFLYPIQAYTFGIASPYFPLNILWLPLIEFLILPSAFLGLFTIALPLIPEICIQFASGIASIFIAFLDFLHDTKNIQLIQVYRPSLWQAIGFYLFIITCLYHRYLGKQRILYVLLSFILIFSAPIIKNYDAYRAQKEERVTLTLLDVGQGQSVLIEWVDDDGAKRALIDAGGIFGNRFDPGRDIVAKVLTYQDFAHIDLAFVSHFDSDHAKGFFHIVRHFSIDHFYYSNYNKEEDMRKALLYEIEEKEMYHSALELGDRVTLIPNILWLEVVFPPTEGSFSSNNASLILRLVYKNKGLALICGDSEGSAISRLVQRNVDISADVLILPHHGSENSYNVEFYNKVDPIAVAASASRYNRYNFPAKKIEEYFEEQGIDISSTGHDYALEYVFKQGKLE